MSVNRITLHECRHTFASLTIAAGVKARTFSTLMGLHDACPAAQGATAEDAARAAGGVIAGA